MTAIDSGCCLWIVIAATIDLGCCLSIGIAATIDLGCCQLIGIEATIGLGWCLLIGIAVTIDLGCCLLIGIAATIDLGAAYWSELRLQVINVSSIKWNCGYNWFGPLLINWNCGHNWFGYFLYPSELRPQLILAAINRNCGYNWCRVLSINWNWGYNWFRVLFINRNCFGCYLLIGIAATIDFGISVLCCWSKLRLQLISGAVYQSEPRLHIWFRVLCNCGYTRVRVLPINRNCGHIYVGCCLMIE